MNKLIIFISMIVFIVLLDLALSVRTKVHRVEDESRQIRSDNLIMERMIEFKETLPKTSPIDLSGEYWSFLNEIKSVGSLCGIHLNVGLEKAADTQDIFSQYEDTQYRGVKGLRIRITSDRFSKGTGLGDLLDEIFLLEQSSDFRVDEISQDNNNLIVKGELYGI